MKIAFLQIFLVLLCLSAHAQKVSNIRAEQRGQDIVLFYSLETPFPCEVSLLLSQDNGSTWGVPLKNVTGDVGKNISGGEKQIVWKVLEEKEYLVGDKMKFKVITNGRKSFEPEMVFVEGGTFQMGGDVIGEKPKHMVTLSDFYIGKFEITQSQWLQIMSENPSFFEGCGTCPVEEVTWSLIEEYIKELNRKSGKNYRLPTEAEWEYAAKGGKYSKGYKYSGSDDINTVAWFGENSKKKTHAVGTKKANEIGIYDMTGNVWEICGDWYSIYGFDHEFNPKGPEDGKYRVLRGGNLYFPETYSHSTYRLRFDQTLSDYRQGFRLVLPLE
jgi:formylglycine-generating enzyme required for sulfatase activity